MKFGELKEGKEYKGSDGHEYKIVLGGLYSISNSAWCGSSMHTIMEKMDFEEVKEYVPFQEAVEWMKCGGSAIFKKREYKITGYYICGRIFPYSDWEKAHIDTEMLEPKWELIK